VLSFRDEWVIAWSPEGEPFNSVMENVINNFNATANNVTFKCKYTENKKYDLFVY
jgi:hypothetical protein